MEKGTVYFFTGLSGAGKTTLGGLFHRRLKVGGLRRLEDFGFVHVELPAFPLPRFLQSDIFLVGNVDLGVGAYEKGLVAAVEHEHFAAAAP